MIIASRTMKKISKPNYLLCLETAKPGEDERKNEENASGEGRGQVVDRSSSSEGQKTMIECDYANLLHLQDVLEAAIKDLSNKHVKRVMRYVR